MGNLSRRLLLQAIPFIGASAAIPVTAAAAVETARTTQEQIDHHIAELAKLISETAGPCDGWRVHIGVHPWDKEAPIVRAERYWRTSELMRSGSPRMMDVDRMREFDPRNGDHTDYLPVFDLSQWKPRTGGEHV